jgi:3-oxoadipate enol-lactonase
MRVRPSRPTRKRPEIVAPPLPPSKIIDLPGRGSLPVRLHEGPLDKRRARRCPPLMLVHGWTVTADLNYFELYERIGERHTFAAFDQRGHGLGLRSPSFSLEECADDVAAVADALGWDEFVVVGYSMGGTIAQLVAHRHPDRCAGLVLCSTAAVFAETRTDRLFFDGVLGNTVKALHTLPKFLRDRMPGRIRALGASEGSQDLMQWMESQTKQHNAALVAEAGQALGRFRSEEWLGTLNIPVAVVITTEDTVVGPTRQRQLAASIPNASTHTVALDHSAATSDPDEYWPVLDDALANITRRQPGKFRRTGTKTLKTVQHLFVSGRVQDVGFRQSMQQQAASIGVTGWVRNRRDGRVEAVIAGTRERVDELLAWTRQGPPMASVTDVRTARSDDTVKLTETADRFEIRPTE